MGNGAATDTAGLLCGARVGVKLVVESVRGSASPSAMAREATALSSSGKGGGCLILGQLLRSQYWSKIFW